MKYVLLVHRFDHTIASEHDVESEKDAHATAQKHLPDDGGFARLVTREDLDRARKASPGWPPNVPLPLLGGEIIGRTNEKGRYSAITRAT